MLLNAEFCNIVTRALNGNLIRQGRGNRITGECDFAAGWRGGNFEPAIELIACCRRRNHGNSVVIATIFALIIRCRLGTNLNRAASCSGCCWVVKICVRRCSGVVRSIDVCVESADIKPSVICFGIRIILRFCRLRFYRCATRRSDRRRKFLIPIICRCDLIVGIKCRRLIPSLEGVSGIRL